MHRVSRLAFLLAAQSVVLACGAERSATRSLAGQPRRESASAVGSHESAAMQTHRKRRSLPTGTDEGAQESLLAAYAERELPKREEIDEFELTGSAKTIAVSLLTVAAKDRIEDLPDLLADGAGWGLPDRRELGRRPIMADGGEDFLTTLRDAAARFEKAASFTCFPLMPAMETYVATGAEPMWCFYSSDDRLDLLVFKLVAPGGRARIAYVGLFAERPQGRFVISDADVPPPMRPPALLRGLDSASAGELSAGMQADAQDGSAMVRAPSAGTPAQAEAGAAPPP